MHPVFSTDAAIAIPLHAVTPETWTATAEQLGLVDFVRATGFDGAQGALCLVPGRGAGLAAVLYGLGKKSSGNNQCRVRPVTTRFEPIYCGGS